MDVPLLLRNIGEDKWEHGESLIKSGNLDVYTVEMFNGFEHNSVKWKFVVAKENEHCFRMVYDKQPGGEWNLRNKVLVL